jgi:hypothetical protein
MQEGGDLGRRPPASGQDLRLLSSTRKLQTSTVTLIDVGPSVREELPDTLSWNQKAPDRAGVTVYPPFATYRCTGPDMRRFRNKPLPMRPTVPIHFLTALAGVSSFSPGLQLDPVPGFLLGSRHFPGLQ